MTHTTSPAPISSTRTRRRHGATELDRVSSMVATCRARSQIRPQGTARASTRPLPTPITNRNMTHHHPHSISNPRGPREATLAASPDPQWDSTAVRLLRSNSSGDRLQQCALQRLPASKPAPSARARRHGATDFPGTARSRALVNVVRTPAQATQHSCSALFELRSCQRQPPPPLFGASCSPCSQLRVSMLRSQVPV